MMFKTPLETALESELAKRGLMLGDALYHPDLLLGVKADAIIDSAMTKKESSLVYDAKINEAILSEKFPSARRRTVEMNGLKLVHDVCVPYQKMRAVPEQLLDCIVQSQLLKKSGKNVYEYIQFYEKGVGSVPWILADRVTETPRLLAVRQYSEPVETIAEHILDYADLLVDNDYF